MKPDFSGYATKANVKCSDGRVIKPVAFQHQDGEQVPLVWEHRRTEPANILGHAILRHRDDGTYIDAFFNTTQRALDAKQIVMHGDIRSLSIYANKLVQNGDDVLHGEIKEVSLVVAGANPLARIDNVVIEHSDGLTLTLDEEAIIYSDSQDLSLSHADKEDDDEEETVADVIRDMSPKQQAAVAALLEQALKENLSHSDDEEDSDEDSDEEDSDEEENSEDEEETDEETSDEEINHSELEDPNMSTNTTKRNVFQQNEAPAAPAKELSHSEVQSILSVAKQPGEKLSTAFLKHIGNELEHADYGIEDIDVFFPDAKAVANLPELISRRVEWVQHVLTKTKHVPWSRVKSLSVDITADEARAKGYVKGNRKKDEIVKAMKRVTTPTTIYKKQKLDRDDIVDITDLDIVAFLKGEMRLMLDEEAAVAILIGDGREPEDDDKISEDNIRPIASDDSIYTHTINVATNVAPQQLLREFSKNRLHWRGSGRPDFFVSEEVLTDLLLIEDKFGRLLFDNEAALASRLRVAQIVPVQPFDRDPNLLGIFVNLSDYTVGADKGGKVSMFDDFDIDFNQEKYLIETRMSGALTKYRSAVVYRRTPGNVVTPSSPAFDNLTNTITIPSVTGVEYRVDGSAVSGDLVIEESTDVDAFPAVGYAFPASTITTWTFTPSAG